MAGNKRTWSQFIHPSPVDSLSAGNETELLCLGNLDSTYIIKQPVLSGGF